MYKVRVVVYHHKNKFEGDKQVSTMLYDTTVENVFINATSKRRAKHAALMMYVERNPSTKTDVYKVRTGKVYIASDTEVHGKSYKPVEHEIELCDDLKSALAELAT